MLISVQIIISLKLNPYVLSIIAMADKFEFIKVQSSLSYLCFCLAIVNLNQ